MPYVARKQSYKRAHTRRGYTKGYKAKRPSYRKRTTTYRRSYARRYVLSYAEQDFITAYTAPFAPAGHFHGPPKVVNDRQTTSTVGATLYTSLYGPNDSTYGDALVCMSANPFLGVPLMLMTNDLTTTTNWMVEYGTFLEGNLEYVQFLRRATSLVRMGIQMQIVGAAMKVNAAVNVQGAVQGFMNSGHFLHSEVDSRTNGSATSRPANAPNGIVATEHGIAWQRNFIASHGQAGSHAALVYSAINRGTLEAVQRETDVAKGRTIRWVDHRNFEPQQVKDKMLFFVEDAVPGGTAINRNGQACEVVTCVLGGSIKYLKGGGNDHIYYGDGSRYAEASNGNTPFSGLDIPPENAFDIGLYAFLDGITPGAANQSQLQMKGIWHIEMLPNANNVIAQALSPTANSWEHIVSLVNDRERFPINVSGHSFWSALKGGFKKVTSAAHKGIKFVAKAAIPAATTAMLL